MIEIRIWQSDMETAYTMQRKTIRRLPVPVNPRQLPAFGGAVAMGVWFALTQFAAAAPVRGIVASSADEICMLAGISDRDFSRGVERLVEMGLLKVIPSPVRTRSNISNTFEHFERVRTDGKANPNPAESEDVAEVYGAWRKHHPRAAENPGKDARRVISARLSEGLSVRYLQDAIEGNHIDPWCCGENPTGKKYHDLSTILQSGKAEGYAETWARRGEARLSREDRVNNDTFGAVRGELGLGGDG